jgi:exosortase
LAITVLLWSPIAHAVEVWSTDEEFTYGFLIIPIALGLVWARREQLRRRMGAGHNAGLVPVVASILLMLVSRRTGINVLAGVAVTPLLIGSAAYLWGWRAARVVTFPSCFLVFGLGLYRGLLSSVGFVLQDITAAGAAWAGQHLGLSVIRDGLILHSAGEPGYTFIVAQACSGMSSLLSLLALAALWMYSTRGVLGARLAVFAGVPPLVILANTARVTLVLAVASAFGEDTALGFFHGASSLVLFGLALAGLLVLSRAVGCKLPTFATSY